MIFSEWGVTFIGSEKVGYRFRYLVVSVPEYANKASVSASSLSVTMRERTMLPLLLLLLLLLLVLFAC